MSDIRAALNLEPVKTTIAGFAVVITRPTIMDLIEAVQQNEADPANARAFAIWRHLRTEDGAPVFDSLEAAKRCPAHIAAEAVVKIERLYNEGRD